MAVAHREEVAVPQPHNVWVRNIRVLIDLVRVVRRNSTFGSEAELGDDVGDLLGLGPGWLGTVFLFFFVLMGILAGSSSMVPGLAGLP